MENQKEETDDKEKVIDHTIYIDKLSKWMRQKFFSNNGYWLGDGVRLYKFTRGAYIFEIRYRFINDYDGYEQLEISISDCGEEINIAESGLIKGKKEITLHTFKKPISQTLFNELCEHYGL